MRRLHERKRRMRTGTVRSGRKDAGEDVAATLDGHLEGFLVGLPSFHVDRHHREPTCALLALGSVRALRSSRWRTRSSEGAALHDPNWLRIVLVVGHVDPLVIDRPDHSRVDDTGFGVTGAAMMIVVIDVSDRDR